MRRSEPRRGGGSVVTAVASCPVISFKDLRSYYHC